MNHERSTKQKECCQEYHSTCLQAVTQNHSDTQSSGTRGQQSTRLCLPSHIRTCGMGWVAYLTSGVDKDGRPVVDEDGYVISQCAQKSFQVRSKTLISILKCRNSQKKAQEKHLKSEIAQELTGMGTQTYKLTQKRKLSEVRTDALQSRRKCFPVMLQMNVVSRIYK